MINIELFWHLQSNMQSLLSYPQTLVAFDQIKTWSKYFLVFLIFWADKHLEGKHIFLVILILNLKSWMI